MGVIQNVQQPVPVPNPIPVPNIQYVPQIQTRERIVEVPQIIPNPVPVPVPTPQPVYVTPPPAPCPAPYTIYGGNQGAAAYGGLAYGGAVFEEVAVAVDGGFVGGGFHKSMKSRRRSPDIVDSTAEHRRWCDSREEDRRNTGSA